MHKPNYNCQSGGLDSKSRMPKFGCGYDGNLWVQWRTTTLSTFSVFFLLLFFYAAASHWQSKLGQHRSRPQSLIVSGLIFILFSTMRHQFPMSLFVSFLPFHHHSFSYFTFVDKSVFFPFFRGREKTQDWHKRYVPKEDALIDVFASLARTRQNRNRLFFKLDWQFFLKKTEKSDYPSYKSILMGSLINWILILTGPLLRCGMSRGDARDIRANERSERARGPPAWL